MHGHRSKAGDGHDGPLLAQMVGRRGFVFQAEACLARGELRQRGHQV